MGSEEELRDGRYDQVILLTTAADGAERFYTLENNEARHETPEQAREIDARIAESWLGHAELRVINNRTDFEGKMMRAVASVTNVLGLPKPLTTRRKFLLRAPPPRDLDWAAEGVKKVRRFNVEET